MGAPRPSPPDRQAEQPHCWSNSLASFMGRHIRHIHAKSNEWVRVHRGPSGSGGGGGGGSGWNLGGILMAILFGLWIAGKVLELVCAALNALWGWLVAAAIIAGLVWLYCKFGRK